MSDIELVIKMPEEMWEKVKDGYIPLGISKYLKNGTLLPEGHGRIIDESQVTGTFTWDNGFIDCFAPTIIESDNSEQVRNLDRLEREDRE